MSEPENPEIRELKAALAQALEQVEEHRVAAIELRMLLDASEARLASLSTEIEEARAAAKQAEEARESSRVEAIEMRVILDATEHRAARLQDGLAATQGERDALAGDLERAVAERIQAAEERKVLDGLLEEASERLARGDRAVEELGLLRSDFEGQRSALESGLQEARSRLGELEERAGVQAREIADALAERSGLQTKVESLAVLKDSFERENTELRAGAELGREAEQLREENARLNARIAELESLQGEAAQRHSAAVSKYMLELNQRSEELRGAEAERTSLREELELARQMCNDSAAELTSLRGDNESLERKVRELESGRAARPKNDGLRLADSAAERVKPSEPEATVEVARPPLRTEGEGLKPQPLTVVHLEDRPEYREALKEVVSQFPRMHYIAVQQPPPAPPGGPCLLVANLLVAGTDPFAAILAAEKWGLSEPAAFTYCADGGRGVVLGTVDYLPEPFDPDACVSRLLGREEVVQRLLVVSDNVELMNDIRSAMARFKGSTSGALDGRQAFELASLVRPEYVLVDLALPRGEGFRLVARLRSDPKTAAIPLGFLWGRKIDASDLRSHAARVARDTALGLDEFKRNVQQTLTERGFRRELLKETA